MTGSEILNFCEEHDVEVSFRFEKEANKYHLRIRRGNWQYNAVVTREQIEGAKAGSAIKKTLCYMVDKLDRAENARKAELEGHHDPD